MNTATPEIVSSTFLPEGNLLRFPFGSLIFNSYWRPEFLLHSLEKWACFLFMYEDFFVSSPGYLSLKVLEWFDYLLPHRRLIITDNRPIAGELRPATLLSMPMSSLLFYYFFSFFGQSFHPPLQHSLPFSID